MDADLSSLWNWNVKQLFVYVMAEYPTGRNTLNQVVVWDSILQEEEFSELKLHKQKSKYPMVDVHGQLRNADVNLTLRWDVMPWVGLLEPGGGVSHNAMKMTMPDTYM